MKSTISLQVDTSLLLRLISQLQIRGGTQDVSEVIGSAIELWLREQASLRKGCDPACVRGYQWKTIFLPEGTELCSWSYGEHNYARVVGDEIIHNGHSVTPNQFAQSFARSTRNAWEDLRIRRPEDKQFRPASRLRAEQAKQDQQNQQATVTGITAALSDTSALALLTALQTQLHKQAALPAQAVPAPPRDTTPGDGWDLPERRKYRYRLEDIAY
ncbi:hypothetical protein GTP46_00205 [Duganella sp. FT135W]|uniref:Uncharacterized protein n=1 Tax=Duganella flavida TaxID=2692175 RepID=A0A6L8K9N7_9BURK|nr:hypothetical protein [Duganella flavida]MYM21071.1 hypothetical protein [Duganella flavida]